MEERIVIIDHNNHTAFIEDIPEEILEKQYHGEEEAYIADNYDLENFSWDYVTSIQYISNDSDPTPMEVEPKDWL